MKKFLHLLIFLSVFFPTKSFCQLDGGGIAPDFTLTDIDGASHTLYDYLDQGKVVVLDFFATWCTPCNNNASEVERVYEDYGPDGNNTIMMFLLESSGRSDSDLEALQSFITTHNVTCPSFHECENTDVPSDYEIGYFPTYYIVYSDRSYKQVSGSSTTIYQTMVDAIAENPGLSSTTYDAKVLEFEDPIGSFCTDSIRPKVTLQNYGTETLNSVDIKSIIDGNVIKTYNWTGSLAQYEIDELELADITGIDIGNHTFTFTVEKPNGETDLDNSNDSKDTPFIIVDNGAVITLSLTTDDYPSETSWAILDGDEEFTSAGGYSTANTLHTEDICVYADSCYTFTIYDSYGDGNSNKPVEITLNGYVLGSITNFSSGSSKSIEFCALIPPAEGAFNPENGATNVSLNSNITLTYDMAVRLIDDTEITDPTNLITLKKDNESGEDVAFTATINDDKTVIVINPENDFVPEQNYYVNIGGTVENEYDIPSEAISSVFTTEAATNTELIERFDLSIYPNPFKDQLFVSFNNENRDAFVKIYNQTGVLVKLIYTTEQKVEIDTEDMANGIYFLNLEIDNTKVAKKLILLR